MSTSLANIWSGIVQRRRLALHPLQLVVSERLWKSLAFVLLNLPMSLVYFLVLFTLLSVGVGFLPVGIGLAPLALVPPLTLVGARIERRRVTWLLGGVSLLPDGAQALTPSDVFGNGPASEKRPSGLHLIGAFFRHSWQLARQPDTWRNLAYLLLLYPIATLEALGFKAQIDVFRTRIAVNGARGITTNLWTLLGLSEHGWLVGLGVMLIAVLWLFVEAYLIVGVAGLHRALAQWLLGPSPREQQERLEARVRALDQSRTRLLDAVLLERQRLERDLHDGAQQRLVALALDLGMAREKLATQPEEARALLTQAHEEAKRALAELRDLVRGIHPAVLSDRGLDPALSALAARCPVPVAVAVNLAERPPEVVEATAYFIAAESLTNIAKHSRATDARIEVRREARHDGDLLLLAVSDNGDGGADTARGTGLAGIADRVAALDGRLTIDSPPGGPTNIIAELPWRGSHEPDEPDSGRNR